MKKFKSICEADTRVSVKGTKSNYAVWRFIKNIGRGTFLDRQSTLGTGIIGEDFLKVAKKILEDNITVYTKTGEKIAINPNLDDSIEANVIESTEDVDLKENTDSIDSVEDIDEEGFIVPEDDNALADENVEEKIKNYIVNLVFATRFPKDYGLEKQVLYFRLF